MTLKGRFVYMKDIIITIAIFVALIVYEYVVIVHQGSKASNIASKIGNGILFLFFIVLPIICGIALLVLLARIFLF